MSGDSNPAITKTGFKGLRPIGGLAAKSLEPAARARGFATLALLQDWPAIAGAELARFTAPDRVIWPRQPQAEEDGAARSKRPQGAILVLRVDGPRALEVQYRASSVLERINGYFGYRAVVELRLLQAPIAKAEKPPRRRVIAPDPAVLPGGSDIASDGLKEALIRLGSALKDAEPQG